MRNDAEWREAKKFWKYVKRSMLLALINTVKNIFPCVSKTFPVLKQNSLCFPCLEKVRTKFPVFPVPWPPCCYLNRNCYVALRFKKRYRYGWLLIRDKTQTSTICVLSDCNYPVQKNRAIFCENGTLCMYKQFPLLHQGHISINLRRETHSMIIA